MLAKARQASNILLLPLFLAMNGQVFAQDSTPCDPGAACGDLKFIIPSFADILTFVIRVFFVVAGIFALVYLLLGAFSWITSGGDKEKVEAAQKKIQAALVGVILIIIVVAIVATLEQIVFNQTLCFGLTCKATIPSLLQPK